MYARILAATSDVSPIPRPEGLHEQTVARLNNLEAQVAAGFEAHPYRYPRTHHTRDVLEAHSPETGGGALEAGQKWEEETYTLAGRVTLMRHMGKAAFADRSDEDGTLRVQRPNDERQNRALHGLSRTLIANMITGVTERNVVW
mgnify:CR=1 FL=1